MSWDITNQEWYPKTLSMTSTGGTVNVATSTDSGTALTYNLEVNITNGGATEDNTILTPVELVVGSASGGTRSIGIKYNSNNLSNSTSVSITLGGSMSASGYVTDTTASVKKGGIVHLGGAYSLAIVALAAGIVSPGLGTLSVSGQPSSAKVISTFVVDEATDTSYSVLLMIDTSGNLNIKNVSGGALNGTYTINLTGLSYVA
jgi:hypothetical protein